MLWIYTALELSACGKAGALIARNTEIDTIGVISYDASIFLSGLNGHTLAQGRATYQAGEILEFLLTQFISHRL